MERYQSICSRSSRTSLNAVFHRTLLQFAQAQDIDTEYQYIRSMQSKCFFIFFA